MNQQNTLSNVTKDYLMTFNKIFEEMKQKMTEAKLTNSISYNFIVQMIPHHYAAIEMSKNILKYTTNLPLQNIAAQIITEQTKSIENMCNIEVSCSKKENFEKDVSLYQKRVNQIMQVMFQGMQDAKVTNSVNEDFIREMIPHHKGAIEMSENALQYYICQELKPILQAIIVSQRRGVRQMSQLLCRMQEK